MLGPARRLARKLIPVSPTSEFQSDEYLRHNARRLEHLATLGLPIEGHTVLEVGAGIGDHTSFFVDRGCTVTTSDGRPENVAILRRRYPDLDVRLLDLDNPDPAIPAAEVVYCYGTLYHLSRPEPALEFLAERCTELLLLETCVSLGTDDRLELVGEPRHKPSQALSGTGCRPTRTWIERRLAALFPHVYLPLTQPAHPEFPTDWTTDGTAGVLTRAIFIASREPLDNALLTTDLPQYQRRA